MSALRRPASAMAHWHASTVRSSDDRPKRRPTADCPIPVNADACSNLLSAKGLDRLDRHEHRVPRAVTVHESHTDPHANVRNVEGAVHQVGGQPQALLLVEFDHGDDVGPLAGHPWLVVDGEGMYLTCPRDDVRLTSGAFAAWAKSHRGVHEVHTVTAPLHPQQTVGATGPEEGTVRVHGRGHAVNQDVVDDGSCRTREGGVVRITAHRAVSSRS